MIIKSLRDCFTNSNTARSYDNTVSNSITTAGFEYDAAGNQTRAKRADGAWQRFVYDAANRLVEVKNDANTVTYESYRYGVGNQRVTSEAGGLRTYYAGGGGQSSVEYTQAVSGGGVLHWSKSYIYAGGSVLATISPNGASEYVEYHHPDRLGTRLISNNANTQVQEQETLPYGAALSSGSSTRQFTSYDRSSATGLDYAVNRRYDSLQGRFTQVDPIGAGASSLTDPQSWNMYAYCGNDPVNHVDPDGLFFKKLFKWFKKHWKAILLIAVIVAIAIIATPGAAGFLKGLFVKAGWKMGFLSKSFVADKAVYGLSGLGKGLLGSAAGGLVGRLAQDQQGQDTYPDEEIEIRTDICKEGDKPPGGIPYNCILRRIGRGVREGISVIGRFLDGVLQRVEEGSTIEMPGINGEPGMRVGMPMAGVTRIARVGIRGLGTNPFKGKTVQQIGDMFTKKGYIPKGPDPLNGQGTFVNPRTGRGYHIDANHPLPKGPHVGVHRRRGFRDTLPTRDYKF